MSAFKKYGKIFSIGMSDMFAWRFGFFMITLGTAIGWFVMLLFWAAIYREGHQIGNFSLRELLLYYTFITIFTVMFDTSFIWDIATAVHEGRLTEFLIKPVSYLQFQSLRELGARTTTILAILPLLVGALIYFWHDIPHALTPWLSTALLLAIGFVLVMLLGFIVALGTVYFESPYHLPSLFFTISALLSGRTVPLELMPHWLQAIAYWSPFPLLGSSAVEIILGSRGGITLREIALSIVWLIILLFGARIAWKHAAIKYEAGGI